jgi:uncharacterized protein YxjI
MKNLIISLLLLSSALSSNLSRADSYIPDEVFVNEHWISLTKSYDIETRTQKLGTLYRRFISLFLTYDFYNPMDVKVATAKARFFSFGAHLDIYDQSDAFIGGVEEKIFTFFPAFEIIAKDSRTKLARAEMNFWGTRFYIYDTETGQEMAIMSRPLLRLKNDWTINVTNRALLEHKNIDSRVLMTVIALQGEIEDWQKEHKADNNLRAESPSSAQLSLADYEALLKNITTEGEKQELVQVEKPNSEQLEFLANELDDAFKAEHESNGEQNNSEQVKTFAAYCLSLVNSNSIPDSKKKAILVLLSLRLQGH